MKKYYFFNKTEKEGPFTLEELASQPIFEDTLIWYNGLEDWTKAYELPELEKIIKKSPPPIPINEKQGDFYEENYKPEYDYSEIEDIAGVDYKVAMMLTGGYLVGSILLINLAVSSIGMLGIMGLAVSIWWFFKQYFDAQKDVTTGKCITVIMGAHALFGLVYLYISSVAWGDLLMSCNLFDLIFLLFGVGVGCVAQFAGHVYTIMFLVVIAATANFVAGFRILFVNRRYPFPLKRIALSTMFLMPFLFFTFFSIGILGESSNMFGRIIVNLPYLFLLHHFYKADQEDETA